ncbi:L-aspartate oxidase [Coxiella endosymbiont of Amblyomma sculptum]|uniref:L-aspartate oxidase n=1 Tax=Coxiella endosymbiont of Amblyomma sculptum TaxID=2487929 RepID=UPI00132EF5D5|nr:L-aspartate oxidase [Coxiella endosymbiont of Amblyomma sculptum]QHG92407.1 L-aspartate oxidase [Coxiella endosymbiont of Amblyomma sculptum]
MYDVLIVGSGVSGLRLAISLADSKVRVALLSKEEIMTGSSPKAQGGIAAVMDTTNDSVDLHVQDTLNAGCGLCDSNVVWSTLSQAKSTIEWLVQRGIEFTRDSKKKYHLMQEGGHSRRRILHATDRTGEVVVKILAEQTIKHPNIDYFTNHMAIDLLIKNGICIGALVYDTEKHSYSAFTARHTVLATGGASFIYLHTSNPSCVSGDGIAMAWRAGCRVVNLELNQFHPTCLYHPLANCHLISEVVRGEGGYLLLPNGERFMPHYDKRAEMAPRDIVTRAIHTELQKHQLNCIYLDISHRSSDFIKKVFPTIYSTCLKFNLDMTKEPLPVIPAAHYTCGGIITDLSGKTDIPNLYAIGETAFTGLHGANRMASNSLLECLVFASNSAQAILKTLSSSTASKNEETKLNIEDCKNLIFPYIPTSILRTSSYSDLLFYIQKIMWDYVGIVRTNKGLNHAKKQLQEITQQVDILSLKSTKPFVELWNITTVANLTIRSALLRKESRGLHYNKDYPQTDDSYTRNTILVPPEFKSSENRA